MSGFLRQYREMGLSGIVSIERTWHEEKTGWNNEHTYETIVARKGGQFLKISVHELRRFGFSADLPSFTVNQEERITESEYKKLSRGQDLLDTPEALEQLIQADQEMQRRNKLERKLKSLAPKCGKCGGDMRRKYSKHGAFWGCARFPRCDGTARLSHEALELSRQL